MIHNKDLLRKRFSRHLSGYDTLASVQRDVARRLALEILIHAPRNLRHGVEIGAGTGFLTRHMVEYFPMARWTVNDLVANSRDYLPPKVNFIEGDGETMELPDGVDLVASSSTVQWFDDLRTFLARACSALDNGGLLAISCFGPDNFKEIAATTGQTLHYHTNSEISEWLKAEKMRLVHTEEWIHTEHFTSPIDVLHHLRATGVNAIEHTPWTPARLHSFEKDYLAHCAENGITEGVTLTFNPTMIIARKPHDR